MINRRHDDRASCPARHSLKSLLPMEPQIHAPATWKGGHESGQNQNNTKMLVVLAESRLDTHLKFLPLVQH
jgi:hypothetical protein